jgi:DnaJ-domain-containing protein 1
MGIFDRLGDVIKSYLNDEDERIFGRSSSGRYSDPDLEAATEELNEFLRGGAGKEDSARGSYGRGRNASGDRSSSASSAGAAAVPEILRGDFAELGVPFGSNAETCKTAYKKLLKIHHPDRHAGHAENMRKATAKSARINAAFDRIEKWRETGKTGC